MKRLGFFLAVFSVGLVLFLISTGQFTKVFQSGSPGRVPDAAKKAEVTPQARNEIVYHCTDLKKGRERFTLRGRTDGLAALSPGHLQQAQTFRDAVIDIPIYDKAEDPASADRTTELPTHFRLEAREVFLDTANKVARMTRSIVGTGSDGTRFETTDVSLRWEEGEANQNRLWLEGESPVTVSYPRFRLHGEGGIRGLFDATVGLRDMTFPAPVVVAVDRSFMGFEASSAPGTPRPRMENPGTEESSLVFIHSPEGPLVIDRAAGEARFEEAVTIFRSYASPRTPLFPPPQTPDTRLDCRDLRLAFDPENMGFTRVRAQRGPDGPIRAKLASDYTLEGDTLEWDEGQEEARLAGAVRISGPLGVFTANEARLYPQVQHCVLEGNVRARLESEPWHFAADRVEVDYDPGADRAVLGPRAQIRRLVAISRDPNGIAVTEDIPDGARLFGSVVTYERDRDGFRVTPPGTADGPRPVFHEGPNRIEAGEIELSMKERSLLFKGEVTGQLESVPSRAQDIDDQILRWLPRGKKGERADIRCEDLLLEWDDERRLHRIVATRAGGAEPARLTNRVNGEDIAVTGDTIRWLRELGGTGTAGRLVLEGEPGGQRLSTKDVHLSADTIRFDTATHQVVAAGAPVRMVSARSRIVDSASEGDREVVLECRELEAELRRPGEGSGAPVMQATARGDENRPVTVNDGIFSAEGRSMGWIDRQGTLVLEGGGRQRLRRLGPAGTDEISAERITFDRDGERVVFEGMARGTLHQDDPKVRGPGGTGGRSVPAGRTLSWQFEAGRAELDLTAAQRPRGPLLVDGLLAQGGVQITNTELELRFRGSACRWTRADQRLQIYSPDRREWQIFHRGTDPRDEITAREVSVVRVPGDGGTPGHINVLFDDVTEATFHHEQTPSSGLPRTFRLDTDHLMLVLEELDDQSVDLREAMAWGEVDFRGDDYKAYAKRCVYRRSDDTLVFLGDKNSPVRLIGPTQMEGRTISVQRTAGGYAIKQRGRSVWKAADIDRLLEKHDRRSDSPR